MNPSITTGAAVAGGSALTPVVQDCVTDIFTWCHLATAAPLHPGSWAALILVIAGIVYHQAEGKLNALPQTSKV